MSILTPQERRVIYFILASVFVGSAILIAKKYTPYNIAPELRMQSRNKIKNVKREYLSLPATVNTKPVLSNNSKNIIKNENIKIQKKAQQIKVKTVPQEIVNENISIDSPPPNDSYAQYDSTLIANQIKEKKLDIDNDPLLNYINSATKNDLMDLPGIGEVIAQRIIDYRNKNGKFKNVNGLRNIEGIGEKKLEKIKTEFDN